MKNYFYGALLLLALLSCSKSNLGMPDSSRGEASKPSKPNSSIKEQLFEVINLDYPGLEKAKGLYEAHKYYDAAEAILDYYRLRSSVVNPNISLINVTASPDDQLKANYALDNHRFYVKNYYEDAAAKKPYSLSAGDTINWNFEPAGADDEYQKQLHRHQWFVPQAKVYRSTCDEKHIKSWIETYQDWWVNNPMPKEGTNNTSWWQLQVAERVAGQVQLFDYYKNSASFTPEWLSYFLCYFAQQADFLVKYPYSGGNIFVSQSNALAFAGVLFPEFKNAKQWRDTGYKALAKEANSQFLADGMHFELDLSYHIGTIANFYETMKLAEANPSLTADLPTDFSESLERAAETVMYFTYPNYFDRGDKGYLVPGFNDTRPSSWTHSVLGRNFNRYHEMFPSNEQLHYMASQGKQGTCPPDAVKALKTSGYYMMRNGWSRASTLMILSNNYTERPIKIWSHNQPDNGTFELYHKGRNFFPDTGVYTYFNEGGDNSDRTWFRHTKVHNTMTLNHADITAASGKTLLVLAENNTEIVATENQGYPQLKHRRYVFFVEKTFFVLIDEGIGEGEGTISLNYNLCEGSHQEVQIDPSAHGAHTAFADKNNLIIRTFGNYSLETKAFDGEVSYTHGVKSPRQSYVVNMEKKAHQTARYITVIYPAEVAETVQIDAQFKNKEFQQNGVAAEVYINGIKYELNCNL